MNLLNLIEDQTSGYENLRALMRAVNSSSDAQLDLDGEPITLTYPEARFMMGKYKAYNKVGRQAEFIRDLGDARQFDLHMKQLRDLMQKQKDFRGSVPGERGVSGDTYPGQLEEISQSFEAKKKESGELDRDTAIDPKVQRAFQIARGRQAAESVAEKNDQQDRISTSARTDRMLTQLRIKNPQAENDLEALIYDVDKQRRRQDRDEIEIARLDFENDREEADIDRIERDLQRIKKQNKVAESVEIISGEFQGQRATIVENKRHFVTVDIQGFGRRVIHESRVAEMQTDINRFNIDQPMLPSGVAKVKYARDNDMYDDARMQESLRAGEYHVATVTLDDGTKHRVKLPSDEGFRDLITRHFERKGRKVTDIDVDWSVRSDLGEKKDACYNKVRSRYKVWPSAYASGALVQCRKKGAANWGEGGKKK